MPPACRSVCNTTPRHHHRTRFAILLAVAFYCATCGHRAMTAGPCPRGHAPLFAAPFGSLLGEAIGNFVVVGELGAGGMGAVYRGIHPQIGSTVAIKVLHASCATDAAARERLLREAQLVNRIASPGVAKVSDAGVLADGRPYLVMELLVGENLAQRLERDPRPPLQVTYQILDAVLETLAAAHAAATIHRDLKPENVFLVSDGRIVVLDFGVAKLLDLGNTAGLTSTGAAVGTPAYMAPEQIRGGVVDARTDVYAAGVVLYELLAGRRPFLGTDFEVLSAHVDRRPAPPRAWFPEIPIDLQDIALIALAKDPERRFQAASAMRAALGHVARRA